MNRTGKLIGMFGIAGLLGTLAWSWQAKDTSAVWDAEQWRNLGAYGFERWLDETLPLPESEEPLASAIVEFPEQLSGAWLELLSEQEQRDVPLRAALILVRSGGQSAAELLLDRLEMRSEGPERDSDSCDVIAAAGLVSMPGAASDVAGNTKEQIGASTAERLTRLAVGERPHPDLEVRVECAASALYLGREEVVPFLLTVLRAGTEAETTIDWTPKETMAWSKSRAAHALSLRAGVPVAFRPDGSYADQVRAAEELEELLTSAR